MTYLISGHEARWCEQLPWQEDECDAFIAILEPERLIREVADDLSVELVRLRTDWSCRERIGVSP
jgi:hypothetical protein